MKTTKSKTNSKIPELGRQALLARAQAHAPYSRCRIGAALETDDGRFFDGCNVENASYGGTVCAERVAIFKAVSEGATFPIREIWVASDSRQPWPPCGMCRQVLAEFAAPETKIHTINPQGVIRSFVFAELFPEAFQPSHLLKRKNQGTKKQKSL